jgi:hypothetical protein
MHHRLFNEAPVIQDSTTYDLMENVYDLKAKIHNPTILACLKQPGKSQKSKSGN